jgi:uncharacterized protein YlzI (FlbEa/FlbD family)
MSDLVLIAMIGAVPSTIIGLVNGYYIYHMKHSLNSVLDKRVLDAHTIGTSEGEKHERDKKGMASIV